MQALARPSDADAVRAALRQVRRLVGVPLAFGGELADGEMRLTTFDGLRTTGLRGLLVEPGAGLGGRVLARRRPAVVTDYASERRLSLSAETVKAYLRSATHKLGVRTRTEAVVAARRQGLLL